MRAAVATAGLAVLACLAAGASAVAAEAAPAGELDPVSIGSLTSVALSLAAIVATIVVFGWVARRTRGGGGGSSRDLRVLASRALGARERIVVVAVGGQQLVIGLTPSSMNTLYVADTPLIDAAGRGDAGASRFAERLRTVLKEARA